MVCDPNIQLRCKKGQPQLTHTFIVAQIQLAVNFARNLNIRLNVKNSGHDFNAKSTAGGSLSVWTLHLQDIEFLGHDYQSSSGAKGPAFKVGAGITTKQIYDAAHEQGLMVVGGIARVSDLKIFGTRVM